MRAHSSLKQEASKEENAQDYDDGDNDDLDKSHNVTSRNADCADFKFARGRCQRPSCKELLIQFDGCKSRKIPKVSALRPAFL